MLYKKTQDKGGKMTRFFFLFVVLQLVPGFVVPVRGEDSPGDGEQVSLAGEIVGTVSQDNMADQRPIVNDEEEQEEEACDCGTMAEGECAPCPDGYDE